jgi:gamma-glutamyl:cysteine ligase YbdK (ATP-grasp superfamily)
VWRWNRAVYDSALGGHLRIEMRALPAGPTIVDMLANAAFFIGLALAVAEEDEGWTRTMLFTQAHANFYEAARHGLEAELEWPRPEGRPVRARAAELVPDLLRHAGRALGQAGVAAEESSYLLGVVRDRVAARRTGAVWQRQTVAALEPRLGRDRALAQMLEQYLELMETDQPVHTWPVPA